jgi:hypothetical protein
MARYGGFPWTTSDYLALAASFPFRWFASMDYCVEPEIARDREEVPTGYRAPSAPTSTVGPAHAISASNTV